MILSRSPKNPFERKFSQITQRWSQIRIYARICVKECFFVFIFIFSLFISNLFAVHAEFKMIRELEEAEKIAPPEVIKRPRIQYTAQNSRDPFQRQRPASKTGQEPSERKSEVSGEKPLPSLIVQGLIWGGRFPQAIINNKVVKIGATIEGVSVIGIDKGGVTVSFQEREYRLPSPAASAKTSQKP